MFDISARFNGIGTIDGQTGIFESHECTKVMHEMADIIRRFGHLAFDITLTHRHNDLPPGHIMVHVHDAEKDICTMKPQESTPAFPSAYHLHDGELQPYEFSSTPTPTPSSTFLAAVAAVLRAWGDVGSIFGLSYRSTEPALWVEHLLADGSGTIAEPCLDLEAEDMSQCVVTKWSVTEGSIEPSSICIKTPAGHLVKPKPSD